MAPRVEPNITNRTQNDNNPPPVRQEQPKPPVKPLDSTSRATRLSDLQNYGSAQRERLERLYGAGAAGLSSFNDVRLSNATARANQAYTQTYQQELNALTNPATVANPPKNLVEVANRAETAYRAELIKSGFNPADVRGASALKVVDFLQSEATRGGNFTTLSPGQIQNRLQSGDQPGYFVRVVDSRYLTSPNATYSKPGQPNVWVATPQEIAGAKLDGFEVMRRVGFDDNYISQLQASGRRASDFTLVVVEASGTTGQSVPTWNRIFDLAQNSPTMSAYQSEPPSFWDNITTFDYKSHVDRMQAANQNAVQYAATLTPDEAKVFLARNDIETNFGVNKFFTADGRTARTDGRNGGYGVREFLIDNNPVAQQQRQAYIQLRETGITELDATDRASNISNNPLRLGSEMRTGGIVGGTMSAVTSLPQVFDQARNGDYLGATTTLVTNTGLGTGVGAFSAAGERIIGNSVDDALGRFGTSALTSTSRQVIGRVAGGSAVGGIVNGAFSAYDQIGAYNRGEVSGSQAIGTVTGEVAVGMGAGLAGAAAGAAIGSIIPGAGTIVGGVIGFGVGLAAGYLADQGLRGLGVNTAIASGVTWAIDNAPRAFNAATDFVGEQINNVTSTVSNVAEQATTAVRDTVGNLASGAVNSLRSVFG